MKKITVAIILLIVIAGFRSGRKNPFIIPEGWPQPVYNVRELTANSIMLGRTLFYDPVLSADNSISCASCHSPYNAFAHSDHALSHGIHDSIGNRNAPSLMNLAWQPVYMWDGAVNHLEVQALAPISNSKEMGERIGNVTDKLHSSTFYKKLFKEAYGDTLINSERTLRSISHFLLSIVSCNAKYDSVMHGNTSFTLQEENGYRLYKKNCSSCHIEPLFTSHAFENNGLAADPVLQDSGRMIVTNNPEDLYKFKVPTLRNIEFSAPYMHDGRFKRLGEVLNHYTAGIVHYSNLSASLKDPVELTSAEKVDLISFLLTLTDKKYLFNPDYTFPGNLLTSARK